MFKNRESYISLKEDIDIINWIEACNRGVIKGGVSNISNNSYRVVVLVLRMR